MSRHLNKEKREQIQNMDFVMTSEHDCLYLNDQRARTTFLDPNAAINLENYSLLSDYGFRRSGNYLYRPTCKNCSACIPVRIPVKQFQPTKSQKRIIRRNNDLTVKFDEPIFNNEYYSLYSSYISNRHKDGSMYPPTQNQYESFLLSQWGNTKFLSFRLNNKLLAVAVIDVLDQGLSAIYTFFDHTENKRSLGVYAVLRQIEEAKTQNFSYIYLGYWIKQCQKMSYKINYRPIECFYQNRWILAT